MNKKIGTDCETIQTWIRSSDLIAYNQFPNQVNILSNNLNKKIR